ncbi:MAG: 4Fe-4S cluster-binding domain-containing protein [Bacteroidales bacterium]|nr:4Fe-4S cluster-binding domain-containing protein [Bacteroidales bacterium]
MKKRKGKIVALILTHSCNLNCVYCFEKHKSSKSMSLDTAVDIVNKEIQKVSEDADTDYVKFDLFGGEPLLKFDLIKDLVEYTTEHFSGTEYYFSVTTNGTLLTDEKKLWFKEHKDVIELIMSVDGSTVTHLKNRGCNKDLLPIDFVVENWPDLYLKMTISSFSLNNFAQETIDLLEKGYNVSCALEVGNHWQSGDEIIYARELEKLANYYLGNRDKKPAPIFWRLYGELLVDEPLKNCGCGTTMTAYDIDGRPYPCHMFVPLVHGKEIWSDLQEIDFSNRKSLEDPECNRCVIKKLCRTCYGFNYNQRGSVQRRDKSCCKMFLAEAKVVSAFLIEYLMSNKDNLTIEEIQMLQGALKCYELTHDTEL